MVVDVTADTGTFGPIAGGSYASVTNAFYCEDSALTGKDSGKNTTGTPKTTAELKDAAILTRLGSAFGIYAGADGLKNAGFPYLLNAPALPVIQPQSDMALEYFAKISADAPNSENVGIGVTTKVIRRIALGMPAVILFVADLMPTL